MKRGNAVDTRKKRNMTANMINAQQLLMEKEDTESRKLMEKGIHTVKPIQLKDSENIWFYKTNQVFAKKQSTDHKNGEYEAAASALYRLLVGDRVALTKGV